MSDNLPAWVTTTSLTGLFLIGLGFIVPRWIERGIANAPKGRRDDPLPPDESTPDPHLFQFPVVREVSTQEVADVLRRRWLSQHEEPLSDRQLVPLLAHVSLATKRGTRVVSNNLFGLNADRLYRAGMWTVTREPEWTKGQPVYRWRPIRAFFSLDAAAAAWLRMLPPEAEEAIERGDVNGYADALANTGMVMLPPRILRPELKAEARRFLAA